MRNTHTLLAALFLMLAQFAHAQCKTSKIYTQDGLNEVFTCPQDGNADIITFMNNDDSGSNFAYAITNSNNEILNILTGNAFDFNPMPEGKSKVWGFSYTGSITATVGEDVFETEFSNDCFKISKTAIKIHRDDSYCTHAETVECQASNITTTDGENKVYTCNQDNISDLLTFTHNDNSGSNFVYVITDKSYKILNVVSNNSFNFTNSAEGKYIVWGFSYTGDIMTPVGENVFDTKFSDRCWKISRNCIEVMVENCSDSTDSGSDPDPVFNVNTVFTVTGEMDIEICTGDGMDDVIIFEKDSNAPYPNYAYIVTNESNVISAFPLADSYNFDGLQVGVCRVYGVAYSGNITAQIGEDINAVFVATAFELSSNFITVTKKICGSNSLNINLTDAEIKDDAIVSDIDESNPTSDNVSIDSDLNNNRIISSIDEINISPNPTSDNVFIDLEIENDMNTEQTVISVYSAIGKLHMQKTVATVKGQNRIEMNLNDLNQGLYRIVIQNGQTIKTKTLSKVNIR